MEKNAAAEQPVPEKDKKRPVSKEDKKQFEPENGSEQPVLRNDKSKRRWTWIEMKKHKVAYLMIAPFFLLFFTFTVVPVLLSVVLSFTTFNMLEFPKFVFFDNYIRLFLDDDIFLLALKNTFVFAVITGPVSYLLSLFIAWFINELKPKLRAFVTLIFYAPSIAGNVYLIWTLLFSGDQYGLVNSWLMRFGIKDSPILWLQDTKYIFTLVVIIALWTSLGTSFLTFIAGFQVADKALYEAGAVDGVKNRWQELWYITLPTMKPQLMLGAILAITNSFGFGAVITALVGFPSPEYCVHTIMHHLQDYGGMRFEMGYASAIATILFMMMVGANAFVTKMLRKVGT